MLNDVIQLWMHHRLAAGDGNNRSTEFGQLVQAPLHDVERHRGRIVIIFVAVTARQITPAHGNDVSEHRMARRKQGASNKPGFAYFQIKKLASSHYAVVFTGQVGLVRHRSPAKNIPDPRRNARQVTFLECIDQSHFAGCYPRKRPHSKDYPTLNN